MAIISVLLNISVILIYLNLSKSDQLENDMLLMKQRDDMQYSYYQQLEVEYNNSQKIVHDIKNHIKVIERLYSMNQFSESLEYAQKIYDIVDQLGMKFKSNNRILNIIVNEKMKMCQLHNIKFIYTVENVNLDFISDIDITTIFANILDNAIEACLKIKSVDKQIEFRLYRFNDMIVINLINSIETLPAKYGDEFISTKKDHKAIGLANVKACVKKYDGDFNVNFEQGKFSISIMLPLQDE
jgi:sensor histidine kinase regulating citrate/malate metabolism